MNRCLLRPPVLPLGLGVFLLCAVAGAWAQATPPAAEPGPRVVALEGTLELDSAVRLGVKGLDAWAASHDANKLVPFINGRALRGNYPAEVHAAGDHLHFELQITPQNRAVWNSLLGEPTGFYKRVDFSVGLEGGTPFASDFEAEGQRPLLTVISPAYGWTSLGVVVGTLAALVLLARRTGIIRDAGPGEPRTRPYNLGRAQMAFWFSLTFAAYVVIWLITGAIDTLTPSLLALMGISAGTALSEVLIDANKDAVATGRVDAARAAKQALEQGVAEMQGQLATLVAKPLPTADDAAARDSLNRQLLDQRTQLNQLAQQLKGAAPADASDRTRGFIEDILSDGRGYSFHRFQMCIWTLTLGGVFLVAVYNSLTMPEFSATMLGLMGMSSGTYIGFKFPEQR